VSDGGLAVTLAESCFDRKGLSAQVEIRSESANEAAEYELFGERGGRAVVSLAPASLASVRAIAAQYSVAALPIGTVSRGEFRIQYNGTPVIHGEIDSFRKIWASRIEAIEAR
jgi:phosphoribosylformylglycinamidine (FGAM) synthase-like enzyme